VQKVFETLFANDKISQNFDKRFNIKHLDVIKLMVRLHRNYAFSMLFSSAFGSWLLAKRNFKSFFITTFYHRTLKYYFVQ